MTLPTEPTISIIIPTFGRQGCLEDCLAALAQQSRLPAEVIIVDQNEVISITNILQKFPSLSFQHLRVEEKSPCHARNVGITEAQGDVLLFMDDDAILEVTYLEKLAAIYAGNPLVHGITGTVVNRVVSLNRLKKMLFLYHEGEGTLLPSGQFSIRNQAPNLTRIDCAPSTNISFRRETLEGLRFAEGIRGYFATSDMVFSYLFSRKHNLFLAPALRATHLVSPRGREDTALRVRKRIFGKFFVWRYLKKRFPNQLRFAPFLVSLVADANKELIFLVQNKSLSIPASAGAIAQGVLDMVRYGYNLQKVPYVDYDRV